LDCSLEAGYSGIPKTKERANVAVYEGRKTMRLSLKDKTASERADKALQALIVVVLTLAILASGVI